MTRRRRRFPRPANALMTAAGPFWGGIVVLPLAEAAWWSVTCCAVLAIALSLSAVASVLLGRRMVVVVVRGASMEPTYHDNDSVLVRRTPVVAIGQVVVVEKPTIGADWRTPLIQATDSGVPAGREWLIKRVAAVPGDPVPAGMNPALAAMPEPVVPAGKLVLLGDNQDASFDSRIAGYFPTDRILGTVLRRLSR